MAWLIRQFEAPTEGLTKSTLLYMCHLWCDTALQLSLRMKASSPLNFDLRESIHYRVSQNRYVVSKSLCDDSTELKATNVCKYFYFFLAFLPYS